MTVIEAVGELRELKRKVREIEVSGELRGEHVCGEWHSANYPSRAREGVLYLSVPSRPDLPPIMGYVNYFDDLQLGHSPAVAKSGRQEEFSERMAPTVAAIKHLVRTGGLVMSRIPQLRDLVSPIACGGQQSAIHIEHDIWWLAALFRECAEPVQERDYNNGGLEYETSLWCSVLAASEIVCDRFIEMLSQEHGILVTNSPAAIPVSPIVAISNSASVASANSTADVNIAINHPPAVIAELPKALDSFASTLETCTQPAPSNDRLPRGSRPIIATNNISPETPLDSQATASSAESSNSQATRTKGKTWQGVLPAAESYVQRSGFHGLKALSRQLKCHHKTLRKAINNSDRLRAAEQQYLAGKKTAIPKRRQKRINAVLADALATKTDGTESIATDDIFQRAIEAAETDEKRETLRKMSPAERREWVALISDDPDAEFSFGKPKCAPGRAQVKRPRPR